MRIYELDLHYVLCRPHVFVLMLTNRTDDGGKCYLHQHELFVRASYLQKCTIMCLCQKMQNALHKHNENIADVWLVNKYLAPN